MENLENTFEKVRKLNNSNLKRLGKTELQDLFRSPKVSNELSLVILQILEKRNVVMCPRCSSKCRPLTREEIGEKTNPHRLTNCYYCETCNRTYKKGLEKHTGEMKNE